MMDFSKFISINARVTATTLCSNIRTFFFLEKFDSKLFRNYLTPTQDVAIEETIYL